MRHALCAMLFSILMNVWKNLVPALDKATNDKSYNGTNKTGNNVQDYVLGDRKHRIHRSVPS